MLSIYRDHDLKIEGLALMSRKGPSVGQGMLDFVEDLKYDVFLQYLIGKW